MQFNVKCFFFPNCYLTITTELLSRTTKTPHYLLETEIVCGYYLQKQKKNSQFCLKIIVNFLSTGIQFDRLWISTS